VLLIAGIGWSIVQGRREAEQGEARRLERIARRKAHPAPPSPSAGGGA